MSGDLEVIGVRVEFDSFALSAQFTRQNDAAKWITDTLADLLERYPIGMASRIAVVRTS
jgi:hypothetical protein